MSTLKTATRTPNGEITAAAVELNLGKKLDQGYAKATSARSRMSSERSWKWYDRIGEVHYAISRSARIAGYAQLQCVKLDDAGKIVDTVDTGDAADIVARITSPFGGTRGLIERFYTLMKVPADSYLIRIDDGDGYHFLSPNEMDLSSFARWRRAQRSSIKWITVPASTGEDGNAFSRQITPSDMLGRVWVPNKRFVDMTDAALYALDEECEALYLLTETIKAKLKSRFALAGLFFLPNGISTARINPNQTTVAGQKTDDTLNYLIAAMTKNVRDWENATAMMPILLRGNAEDGEAIRHVTLDREVFETDIELRRELIARILQGLDSQQDAVQGTGDQNHFSAWAASDEERRVAVTPDLETMCWALTRLILHDQLLKSGMDEAEVAQYAVWFNLDSATARSNKQEDARQLNDRGIVGPEATLKMSGIDETEKISDDDYIRWVGRQTKNARLMLHNVKGADDLDWESIERQAIPTGPVSDSPADDPEAGPGGGGADGSPDSTDIDTPRTERPA